MRSLSQKGAAYFCRGYSATQYASISGMSEFASSVLSGKKVISEGTPNYGFYRDILLREADRSLFLSISCFRRSHDLMISSGAFWAHVTLYYSSFLAARSILSMLGCWFERANLLVEVQRENPGDQIFGIRKSYQAPEGSHKGFWTAYYNSMARQMSWVEPSLAVAVSPVNNNPVWQIETRNRINYRAHEAMQLVEEFERYFDSGRFPASLRGDTATQYQVTKTTVLLAADLAKRLSLATNVFASLGSSRSLCIQDLIFGKQLPALASASLPTELSI